MMIEGTQPLLMLMPLITRDTGSIGAGYKYFAKAAKSLFHRTTTMVKGKQRTYGDPELDEIMQRAQNEQIVDFGVHQEFQDLDAMFGVNLRSMLQGGEGSYNPISWGKTLLDKYAIAARDLYSHSPRLNSVLSALSLYKLAREHGINTDGMTHQQMADLHATIHDGKPVAMKSESVQYVSRGMNCPNGQCPTPRRGLFGRRR